MTLSIVSEFPAAKIGDECISAVPVFDHLESVVDFLTQSFVVQEATEKDGLDGLPQFDNGAIGGMLIMAPGKPLKVSASRGCSSAW